MSYLGLNDDDDDFVAIAPEVAPPAPAAAPQPAAPVSEPAPAAEAPASAEAPLVPQSATPAPGTKTLGLMDDDDEPAPVASETPTEPVTEPTAEGQAAAAQAPAAAIALDTTDYAARALAEGLTPDRAFGQVATKEDYLRERLRASLVHERFQASPEYADLAQYQSQAPADRLRAYLERTASEWEGPEDIEAKFQKAVLEDGASLSPVGQKVIAKADAYFNEKYNERWRALNEEYHSVMQLRESAYRGVGEGLKAVQLDTGPMNETEQKYLLDDIFSGGFGRRVDGSQYLDTPEKQSKLIEMAVLTHPVLGPRYIKRLKDEAYAQGKSDWAKSKLQ